MAGRIENFTNMRRAKTQQWGMEWNEGEGFQLYQLAIGVVVALFTMLLFAWILGNPWIGGGLGFFAGLLAARYPSTIDSHYKHPKQYLLDQLRKQTQRTLIMNDRRVPEPPEVIEKVDIPLIRHDRNREVQDG